MPTKMYKIVTLVIVVLAVAGTIIYKVVQSPATKQPFNVQEEPSVRKNNQLPTVLYFGRFT